MFWTLDRLRSDPFHEALLPPSDSGEVRNFRLPFWFFNHYVVAKSTPAQFIKKYFTYSSHFYFFYSKEYTQFKTK